VSDEEALKDMIEIRRYEGLLKDWTTCIQKSLESLKTLESHKRDASSM
jgi:hypothetical protein